MKKDNQELQLNYLLNNCSYTIKNLLYLIQKESRSNEYKKNYKELLQLPIISYWKNCIPTEITYTTILGSSDLCFENSYGKLLYFGLTKNDIISNDILQKSIIFLKDNECNNIYESLANFVVAGYLYASDFTDKIVCDVVHNRINKLFNFITTSPLKFDIYVDTSNYSVPNQYSDKKLVNPILHQNNEIDLPLIYDIFVFSNIYNKVSTSFRNKLDTIIDYITDSRYQSFDYGYGVIKSEKSKYHFMGWSAHLPLFNKDLSIDYFKKGLIYRIALFSKFKNIGIQSWLNRTIEKLKDFKQDDYRYCFPSILLPETKDSYFMNGRHTSLNENRRQKIGKTVESTFYAYLATSIY